MKTIDDICGPGSLKRFVAQKEAFLTQLETERKFRILKFKKGMHKALFSRIGMKHAVTKIKNTFTRRPSGRCFLYPDSRCHLEVAPCYAVD